MDKILVLKLGSTFSSFSGKRGNFEDWVVEKSGMGREFFQIHDAVSEPNFSKLKNFTGVILTGSHDMVTDFLEWSELTAKWLAREVIGKVPILGICYGHQLLAHALGGSVTYNSDGMELGTYLLHFLPGAAADPLFNDMEFPFWVHMSHSQSVSRLPEGAIPLARTDRCEIGAFSLAPFTWGIQFHPEFDAEILRYYVHRSEKKLREEEQDFEAILDQIQETPESTKFLHRFCQFCLSDNRKSVGKIN
ncbi:hypothetical protein B6D60_11470 [candidate division KSB1 bacterium 4484_87]|nr:MAG: hypothetical protein B6D60_11470 [candidate division KSB1 bacterium 4484_87]